MTVDRDARTRLRALCDKAAEGPWFVEHGARADGLSRVDDGRQHGLYSFYCEAHEAAFIAASREAVPELLDMVDAQAKDVDIWKDKAKFRLARAERAEAALQAWLDLGLGCTCKPDSGCAAAIVREQTIAVLAEVPK